MGIEYRIMAQKSEGVNILGGLTDLLVLVLMVGGAGFGGYYLGIHQQLAPIQKVAPGTVGALLPDWAQVGPLAAPRKSESEDATGTAEPATSQNTATAATAPTATAKVPVSATKQKRKYWISSSGVDYIGYSITAKVNGTAVDNFFGPGKNVDITRLVKHGTNTVVFDAKELGEQYNKHTGDEKSVLVVKVVSGPYIQENFSSKDVLLSYSRNAAESEDFNDSKTFIGE